MRLRDAAEHQDIDPADLIEVGSASHVRGSDGRWRAAARGPLTLRQVAVLALQPRAEPAAATAPDAATREVIVGVASSTSRDSYGTRMSLAALESMAAQFKAGVDYLPRHPSWLGSGVEWDEQIGMTVGAEVRRAAVAEPVNDGEEQYILEVSTELWMERELAQTLLDHVQRGRSLGQSIGGWFTEVSYTVDEDGYVTDIIVEDVDLDHLAAVRSAANPDAEDTVVQALRSKLTASRARVLAPPPVDATPADAPEVPAAVEVPAPVEARAPAPVETQPDPTPQPSTETLPVDAVPEQRQEAEMPMTKEEMEQLAALLAVSMTEAMRASVAAIPATPAIAIDAVPAAPATPAPAEDPRVVAAEARARAAEAQLAALQSHRSGRQAPTAAAAPATPAAGLAAVAPSLVDQYQEIAPSAFRAAAVSLGELAFTPDLVSRLDGDEALLEIARARGECRHLSNLLERHPVLLESPEEIAERFSGSFDTTDADPKANTRRSRRNRDRQLRGLLGAVMHASWQDHDLQIGTRGGDAAYHHFV